ncbi:aldo/keto reductase, partial [Streptomyces alkaliphilus]
GPLPPTARRLPLPAQGLGCMRMTGEPDSTGDLSGREVIHRALDLGVTMLDTAELYGNGRNEELVGRALRGRPGRSRRGEALLCTKVGALIGPNDSLVLRGDPDHIRAACRNSLSRLDTDVIDLWYLHRRDPKVPIEESVGAMAEEVAAGRVRAIGLSAVTAAELRAAHGVHPITALQSSWSLTDRTIEDPTGTEGDGTHSVTTVCAELGVAVVPYAPQGAGLLAGAAPGARPDGRGPSGDSEELRALRGVVDDVARRHGVLPGQIALAWSASRADELGVPVVPIPGTTRLAHLEENAAARDIVLSPDDLAALDTASAALWRRDRSG